MQVHWVLGLCLLAFCAGGGTSVAAAPRVEVVASIAPLADLARRVGGEQIRVTVLVPAGSNPHNFSLRPSQAVALRRAGAILLVGGGFEAWVEDVLAGLGIPPERMVALNGSLASPHPPEPAPPLPPHPPLPTALAAEPGSAGGRAEGEGGSAHPWLDPLAARAMIAPIAQALIRLDPAHEAVYRANARSTEDTLDALHREFEAALADVRTRTFVTVHPGYEALARRYGLRALAILPAGHGEEPSASRMAAMVRYLRNSGARAVLAEAQLSPHTAETIAAEAGLKVETLDPLGSTTEGDYVAAMRANLQALLRALR